MLYKIHLYWKSPTSWWLNQPLWKICSSKWESSPRFGVKKPNIFELPPPSPVGIMSFGVKNPTDQTSILEVADFHFGSSGIPWTMINDDEKNQNTNKSNTSEGWIWIDLIHLSKNIPKSKTDMNETYFLRWHFIIYNNSPRNIELNKNQLQKTSDFRRLKTPVALVNLSPCPLSSIANSQLAQQFSVLGRSQVFSGKKSQQWSNHQGFVLHEIPFISWDGECACVRSMGFLLGQLLHIWRILCSHPILLKWSWRPILSKILSLCSKLLPKKYNVPMLKYVHLIIY